MKQLIITALAILLTVFIRAEIMAQDLPECMPLPGKTNEKPTDGTYCIDIAYAEWGGISMGTKLMVEVKGNYVKIIYRGGSELRQTKPGDVIEEGPLVKHKSGVWIISDNPSDKNLDDVGGCSERPTVIDFKARKWWTC